MTSNCSHLLRENEYKQCIYQTKVLETFIANSLESFTENTMKNFDHIYKPVIVDKNENFTRQEPHSNCNCNNEKDTCASYNKEFIGKPIEVYINSFHYNDTHDKYEVAPYNTLRNVYGDKLDAKIYPQERIPISVNDDAQKPSFILDKSSYTDFPVLSNRNTINPVLSNDTEMKDNNNGYNHHETPTSKHENRLQNVDKREHKEIRKIQQLEDTAIDDNSIATNTSSEPLVVPKHEVVAPESKNEDETVTNTRPTDMNIKSQLNEERKSLSTRDREIQKLKVATTENTKELDDSFQTLKKNIVNDDNSDTSLTECEGKLRNAFEEYYKKHRDEKEKQKVLLNNILEHLQEIEKDSSISKSTLDNVSMDKMLIQGYIKTLQQDIEKMK